jgi:dihydropteroate synthase
VISLAALAALAARHGQDIGTPVGPLRVGDRTFDVDARPVILASVNLSRDSTYRESIAVSTEAAIRKGRVLAAQGADFIDLGAESSTARAARVDPDAQIARLVPVIEGLVAEGIVVSAETYEPTVVAACLEAGARILNLTGAAHQEGILRMAAAAEATVIINYVRGGNVREISDVEVETDPLPGLLEYFAHRVESVRAHGVERIVIDPGMGFYYGNLVEPLTRAKHQASVILNTFRLRSLGLPICNAMPHAFDIFEDQFRTAEGFFTVLGMLGGTSMFRVHEVAHVRAVLEAMRLLDVSSGA